MTKRHPLRFFLVASMLVAAVFLQGQAPPATPAQAPGAPAAGGRGVRVPPEPVNFANTEGWTQIFDGKTLNGWDGNPLVWKVEDGAITAESTAQRRLGGTHIIWKGGEPADFELKLEVRMSEGLNSGIAYRSYVNLNPAPPRQGGAGAGGGGGRAAQPPPDVPSEPKWTLLGPGMDFDYNTNFDGNVEERGSPRGEIAYRGGVVRTETGKRPQYIAMIGDADELAKLIHPGEWTQLHIIARGNQLTHIINGRLMSMLFDDDPAMFRKSGLIGLQFQPGIGKISYRNIWLKILQ